MRNQFEALIDSLITPFEKVKMKRRDRFTGSLRQHYVSCYLLIIVCVISALIGSVIVRGVKLSRGYFL